MPLLTENQLALIDKILAKLKERSSISAYVAFAVGLFGVTNPATVAEIVGGVALVAGVLLFLLNDATVRRVLTGATVPATAEAIEPAPTAELLSTNEVRTVLAAVPSVRLNVDGFAVMQPETSTITEDSNMNSKIAAYFAVAKVAASAVLTAEVSAPAGSTGADKLDIAKAALESAYPELGIADVAFEAVWPLVKPFIDALVAKFKTAPAAQTQTAA